MLLGGWAGNEPARARNAWAARGLHCRSIAPQSTSCTQSHCWSVLLVHVPVCARQRTHPMPTLGLPSQIRWPREVAS